MNIDSRVLRAMFDMSGRQRTVNEHEMVEAAGVSVAAVCASIGRLRAEDLAEIRPDGSSRLTLAGLAVAVALGSVRSSTRSWRMSRAA